VDNAGTSGVPNVKLDYRYDAVGNASTGRFISEDPMGFGAGDSNLYRYVGTDPSGNFAIPWVASAIFSTAVAGLAVLAAPDPVQTPTTPCDIDPTDNSGKRMAIEIVTSLGVGIGTTLARRALNSVINNLAKTGGSNSIETLSLGFTRENIQNLRFSQSDASPFFSDGGRVDTLVDALQSGKLTPDDLPALQVVQLEGKLFSINNRRLAAYSLAGVDDIPIEVVSLKDASIAKRFFSRFDPINGEGFDIVIATSKQRESAQRLLREYDMIKGIQLDN
jgi:hypothetical protein